MAENPFAKFAEPEANPFSKFEKVNEPLTVGRVAQIAGDFLQGGAQTVAGIPEMGMQISAMLLNRGFPESEVAKVVTEWADKATQSLEQFDEERMADIGGDDARRAAYGIGRFAPGMLSPSSYARSSAKSIAKRVGQDTGMDVAQGTAWGTAAMAPEDRTAENIGAEAAITGAIGLPLRGAVEVPGALLRGGKNLLGKGVSAEGRAASRAADEVGAPIRTDDLIQNPMLRAMTRQVDQLDPAAGAVQQIKKQREMFEEQMVRPMQKMDAPEEEVAKAFEKRYLAAERLGSDLYTKAARELDPLGNVKTTTFGNRMNHLLGEVTDTWGESSVQSNAVKRWLDHLKRPGNMSKWADRRKELGREIRRLQRSTDPEAGALETLTTIRNQLDEMLDAHAGNNPIWREANDFWRSNVIPVRTKADPIGSAIRAGDFEKAADLALAPGPAAQTRKRFNDVWSKLGKKGKDAYRQALLERVMAKATRNAEGVEIPFSPATAATMLENLKNRLGPEVFGEETSRALDAWRKVFRASEFTGETAARSRTGASLGAIAGLGAGGVGFAMGGPEVGTAMIATPIALTMIIRNPRFRQALIKYSTMPAKHPDKQGVMQDLISMMQRSGATAGAVGEAAE